MSRRHSGAVRCTTYGSPFHLRLIAADAPVETARGDADWSQIAEMLAVTIYVVATGTAGVQVTVARVHTFAYRALRYELATAPDMVADTGETFVPTELRITDC